MENKLVHYVVFLSVDVLNADIYAELLDAW